MLDSEIELEAFDQIVLNHWVTQTNLESNSTTLKNKEFNEPTKIYTTEDRQTLNFDNCKFKIYKLKPNRFKPEAKRKA